jgi:hypothetical protein
VYGNANYSAFQIRTFSIRPGFFVVFGLRFIRFMVRIANMFTGAGIPPSDKMPTPRTWTPRTWTPRTWTLPLHTA